MDSGHVSRCCSSITTYLHLISIGGVDERVGFQVAEDALLLASTAGEHSGVATESLHDEEQTSSWAKQSLPTHCHISQSTTASYEVPWQPMYTHCIYLHALVFFLLHTVTHSPFRTWQPCALVLRCQPRQTSCWDWVRTWSWVSRRWCLWWARTIRQVVWGQSSISGVVDVVVDQSHALPAHSNGVAAAKSIFFGIITVKSLWTTMCFEYPPELHGEMEGSSVIWYCHHTYVA